jgi:DNA-binding NtrC family response regulator
MSGGPTRATPQVTSKRSISCIGEIGIMVRIGLFSEDTTLQSLLSTALGKEFQVLLESSEEGVKGRLAAGECDVVVVDLKSNDPGLQKRIDICRRLIGELVSTVVLADDGLRSTAISLVRMGAYGHCRKPPSIRDLKTILRRAHENSLLKQQLETVQLQLEVATNCDKMIGSSLLMQRVYELVHSVADLNASVLITGESGTGKELIARAIHNQGSRVKKPFVAVSCGAIPETLIESELFGHEKGAFTGSNGAREGYFEQAGDGTLFLDEIGELSPMTQVKLLRVLQQREFARLGSTKLVPLRARVIFATHQNLSDLVVQGKFRQDLYYRINVMKIDSPALAEHPEDIPQIAGHFMRHYSEMYEKPLKTIDAEAMSMLQNYAWPGNVRELENVIQRAIIVARDNSIRTVDLPGNMQEEHVVNIVDYMPAGSFERQLRDYKIKLAETAIRDNNGNKTLAARSLNISRAYLHRLIRPEQDQADEDMEMSPMAVGLTM